MVTDARTLLPTDLLALVSYNGRSYRNEAWTRERIGAEESQHTLGLVLDSFLAFAHGRSAWISVRRQRLQGLVGARRRGARQAWEIDFLIDATRGQEAVPGLLDCAIAEVGRSGAEKLFLRLACDSDLLPVVREAGFMTVQEEVLFTKTSPVLAVADADVRPALPSDSYPLYRLYNAALPESTRRMEAATFAEWHAAQERRWLKNGVQLVCERDGEIKASARAARLPQGIALDLMVDAVALLDTGSIVASAVKAVDGDPAPIYALVPASSLAVGRRLEDAGFIASKDFVSLMRRTTRPLALPKKLMPAIVKSIGV